MGKSSDDEHAACVKAVKGKGTTPKRIMCSVLHRLGGRFLLHRADLPGKPDLVFRSRRAVVFVHGCYWHMHACKRGQSTPNTNAAFWREKRAKNQVRDRRFIAELRRIGWRVLVVWECETKKPVQVGNRLARFLVERSQL